MKIHGVVWAGVRTDRFHEMLAFFRDVVGLAVEETERDFAFGRMPNTSVLEIFGPTFPDHDHFTTGPVPSFLVDDVDEAARELREAGVEVWGPSGDPPAEGWLHFRAPDGTIWGMSSNGSYAR